MFEKEISRKPLTRQVWSARDTPFEFFYIYIILCVGGWTRVLRETLFYIYEKRNKCVPDIKTTKQYCSASSTLYIYAAVL